MNKNIWILIMGFFLFQACLDDEGNYSYSDLLPIEIDSSKMSNSYRITQLDYLVVDPEVKQGVDDSNLSYEWRIFQESNMPNSETGKVVNDVVGQERKLNYKVTTPPGEYTLSFNVTDKQNGVSEVISRKLYVESFASVGLMVMHGDADSTDVSILVNDRIVSDATMDGVKHNIFSITNGRRAVGAPGMVAYVNNTHNVYVYTKGNAGGFRTRGSDLEVLDTYAEMFTEPLESSNIDFQGYNSWLYNDLLVNGGKVYFAGQATTTFTKFGVPVFGVEYYAEPFIGIQERGYYYGIFYDRLQRRFLYVDYSKTAKTFKEAGASAAFDMNNVGKDMVYAEHGFEKKWYCVMRDPANVAEYSVYVCDFSKMDDGNRGVGKYSASGCTDIKGAKAFAVGNRSELLYYATTTEVKQCNFKDGGTSTLRYTLPTELTQAGYEISMLYLFKVSGKENEGKLLYIGVYNPTTEEGKLLECPIVETSGEILKDKVKTYDGFKKITHMAYKSK